MSVSLNPYSTNQPQDTFLLQTQGYIQGTAYDDYSVRAELTAGYLLGTQTAPMWGGVAIQELVNVTGTGADGLGSAVLKSVSPATITAWSVYNQNNSAVIVPGSTAPLTGSLGDVHYFRTGTNARIAVGCSPGLATSLLSGSVAAQVSWDFTNQQLVPFVTAYAANVITASSWASTNGGQVTFTTTSAHGVTVGSYFTISGETPAGYNGDYVAITGTTGSTLVAALTTNPGSSTVQGTLVAGGGAAPCKVLSINSNSKVITYNATTGAALWTPGTAAIILI